MNLYSDRRYRFAVVAAILTTFSFSLTGCGSGRGVTIGEEAKTAASPAAIVADAYLFDAVLNREGKTTSFRLEMYATDSAVGLAGRGYLGKGALRGVLRSDSLKVYFPSTNEYVNADLASLLSDSTCPIELGGFDPVRYMSALPDSATVKSPLVVTQTVKSQNRQEYLVTAGCDWTLTLVYDRREIGWRPVEIEFETTHGTTLRAVRREFRPHSRIKTTKFSTPIPPDAIRVRP